MWLGWARPESTGFSIETLLKIKANLAGVGQARICWYFNSNTIKNLNKFSWGGPNQNLLNFRLKYY